MSPLSTSLPREHHILTSDFWTKSIVAHFLRGYYVISQTNSNSERLPSTRQLLTISLSSHSISSTFSVNQNVERGQKRQNNVFRVEELFVGTAVDSVYHTSQRSHKEKCSLSEAAIWIELLYHSPTFGVHCVALRHAIGD